MEWNSHPSLYKYLWSTAIYYLGPLNASIGLLGAGVQQQLEDNMDPLLSQTIHQTPEIYYTDLYIDIQITQMSKVSPIIKNDRGDKKEFCDGSLQRLHAKEGRGEILVPPYFGLYDSYWLMQPLALQLPLAMTQVHRQLHFLHSALWIVCMYTSDYWDF